MIAFLIWMYEPIGKWLDPLIDNPGKQMEKEADRTALEVTKDVDGASYVLQTFQAHAQQIRTESRLKLDWKDKLLITPSGDDLPYIFTHQLYSNRITSFKTALAQ